MTMGDHKVMEPQPVAMQLFARLFGIANPQNQQQTSKPKSSGHQKTNAEDSGAQEDKHVFVTSRECFELLSRLSALNDLIVEQQNVPGTDSMKESYIRLLQTQASGIKHKLEAKCNRDLVVEKQNQYVNKDRLLKSTLHEVKRYKSTMAVEGSKKSRFETNAIVRFFKGKPLNEKFESATYKAGKYMNRVEDRQIEAQQECEDFFRNMTLADSLVGEETMAATTVEGAGGDSPPLRMRENMLLSQMPAVPLSSLDDDDDDNNDNNTNMSGAFRVQEN